jgi:hypothetical protein
LSKVSKTYTYTNLNSSAMGHQGSTTPSYAMNNGTLLSYARPYGFGNCILVDLNGYSGPNRLGRDLFVFQLINNSLYPYLHNGGYEMSEVCKWNGSVVQGALTSGQCSKDSQGGAFGPGSWCSTVIYCAGWTFPKGYPWD